jgi:threonine/homoserine/homoserine lactone efflux protein
VWLAWKIASSPVSSSVNDHPPIGFVGAATFQWINPKSWLAGASAAATYMEPAAGNAAVQAGALALLFVVAALPCCLVWLACGVALRRRVLASVRAEKTFNRVMGTLLAASVVFFVT